MFVDKDRTVVLALVRKVVCPSAKVVIPHDVDWRIVFEYAANQGVLAICFDALNSLTTEQLPPKDVLLKWMGMLVQYEKIYDKCLETIQRLAIFYAAHSIKMLVLKGYGLSLDWPKPNHRPVGDIDIYLFGDWEKADTIINDCLNINVDKGHEHHTLFAFHGFLVENHYDFINTKVMSDAVMLEKWFKEEAENSIPYYIGDTKVYLPSVQLNVIFLIRHLGAHFSGSEATLRQVLDWAFFIDKHSGEIDWNDAIIKLKNIGIYEFFCQINAICVDCLGMDEEKFPIIVRDRVLMNRIIQDILMPNSVMIDNTKGTLSVVLLKTRRFFVNRWKRKLVYNDSLLKQFIRGSFAHLRRYKTIKD